MINHKLKMAHQAVMLDDANKLLAQTRGQNRSHSRMVGEQPQMPDDESNVHIGDVVHNVQSKTPGWLKAAAITGLALATGGIGAMGAAALLNKAPAEIPKVIPPTTFDPFDVELKWQNEGGEWKVLPRVLPKN